MAKRMIGVRVPEEVYAELVLLAAREKKSVTALAENLLVDSLKQQSEKLGEIISVLGEMKREVRIAAKEAMSSTASCLVLAKCSYDDDDLYQEHLERVTASAKAKFGKEFPDK